MIAWPVFARVQIAILVGVSVKMTQTEQEGAVVKLWTQIASKTSLAQVREWEPMLLNGLASKSLGMHCD